MPNQPPLNPDGVIAAKEAMRRVLELDSNEARTLAWEAIAPADYPDAVAKPMVTAYLAVAQPVVTGEQVNLAGWTCDGIHEPGSYVTCEDCRGACDDLANFYNNMMQQPKADRSWTGRPEVNDA
ncbi:hypothetical protein [Glutamicibacter sp. 2E12]|uniref:hypothetical protein n=1 Tax=Glutamicibacter sp. 2E12 TaxID=3416181 RepID=UPI003CF7EBD1